MADRAPWHDTERCPSCDGPVTPPPDFYHDAPPLTGNPVLLCAACGKVVEAPTPAQVARAFWSAGAWAARLYLDDKAKREREWPEVAR